MRKSSVFWGIVVILAGLLLLLNSFGVLDYSVWKVFWPAFLILLGLWFLLIPVFRKNDPVTNQHITFQVEDTSESEVIFRHGAGRLNVDAATVNDTLLEGDFSGEVEQKIIRSGNLAKIQLSAKEESFIPLRPGSGLIWNVRLNRFVIYRLAFRTGASESMINLSDLQVKEVSLETGASSSTVTMPARAGRTRVEVKFGAASVNLIVPEGVAAHIKVESGLSGININTNRFPVVENGYESPDYAIAENRVDILVESGLGSLSIQ